LKATREKCQFTYKGKNIKITLDLAAETLKCRKTWNNILQGLRINNYQPRIQQSYALKSKDK
jgi:hypothetical protein